MFDKMKELMELKKQADQIKRDLEQATLEVNEVRGIKMVITAAQTLRSVQIDETLLTKENKTRLEQDLLRSFNAAVKKSQHVAADKMKSVMPGLGNFGG